MLNELKRKDGKWYYNIDKTKQYLVLTDDIDSLTSCLILHKQFGIEIGGFYSFRNLYVNTEIAEGKDPIYVDADVTKGMAFGNHVTDIRNKECVNFNNQISRKNYTDKFAGSTVMTLIWLYGIDLKKMNPHKVRFLLTIDSWYLQYFEFRNQWDKWVKEMNMEYLTDIISQEEYSWYRWTALECMTMEKLTIRKNGTVNFGLMDFDAIEELFGIKYKEKLPELKFDKKIATLKVRTMNIKNGYDTTYLKLRREGRIFSDAITRQNSIKYSVLVA